MFFIKNRISARIKNPYRKTGLLPSFGTATQGKDGVFAVQSRLQKFRSSWRISLFAVLIVVVLIRSTWTSLSLDEKTNAKEYTAKKLVSLPSSLSSPPTSAAETLRQIDTTAPVDDSLDEKNRIDYKIEEAIFHSKENNEENGPSNDSTDKKDSEEVFDGEEHGNEKYKHSSDEDINKRGLEDMSIEEEHENNFITESKTKNELSSLKRISIATSDEDTNDKETDDTRSINLADSIQKVDDDDETTDAILSNGNSNDSMEVAVDEKDYRRDATSDENSLVKSNGIDDTESLSGQRKIKAVTIQNAADMGMRNMLHAQSTKKRDQLRRDLLFSKNEKGKKRTEEAALKPSNLPSDPEDRPGPCSIGDAFAGIPVDDGASNAWTPPKNAPADRVQRWNTAYNEAIYRIRNTGAANGGEQLREFAKMEVFHLRLLRHTLFCDDTA